MKYTPTTQARIDLGEAVAAALRLGEDFMREAEARHAKVSADPLFTPEDRRASLTEVTLSHRAIALLRPLAEMLPVCIRKPCTGITASWCPNCGNCKCPEDARRGCGDMDAPNCPLHALNSTHGEDAPE